MPVIFLTEEQLGEFDIEGNMTKRPTKDSVGNDIVALHGTIKRLRFNGKKCFITIPVGKDHPDNDYRLPEEAGKPAAKAAPKTGE